MIKCFSILLLLLSFHAFSADSSQLKALDRYVEIIDAEVKKYNGKPINSGKLKSFYAESTAPNARLMPLKKEFPESAVVVYDVLVDNGKIVYFAEFPTSESGDWVARQAYYFSKQGELRVLRSSIAMVEYSCEKNGKSYPVPAQEHRLYFDEGFRMLEAVTRFEGQENWASMGKECMVPIRLPFMVYPDTQQLPESVLRAVGK